MVSLNYSKISVTALGDLTQRIIVKVKETGIKELVDSDQYTTFVKVSDEYQASLNKKKYTEFTNKVAELDKERDEASIALRQYVNLQCKLKGSRVLEAAEKIKFLLANFGKGIEKMSYGEESQKINGILAKLKEEPNVSYAKTITLDTWIGSLESAQREFERVVSTRVDDKSAIMEVTSATEARKEVVVAMNDFMDLLNLYIKVKKEKELVSLGNDIQIIIDETAQDYNKETATEKKPEDKK